MAKKEKQFSITILYDSHGYCIEPAEDSDEPYSWRGVDGKTFEITSAHIHPPKRGWPDGIDVNFDPEAHINANVYIVVVRYSTGDTFGRTDGEWHLEGAYLDSKKATEIADSINNDTYDNRSRKPWEGYFESLEGVSVVALPLQY